MSPRFVLLSLSIAALVNHAHAAPLTSLSEGFDNVSTLAGSGWLRVNNSSPAGSTDWFQGNGGVFPSAAGAPSAYIAANFENAAPGGAISNWLITPEIDFSLGPDALEFSLLGGLNGFAEAIEVYVSTTGASVGATASSTGDFSLLARYELANALGWNSQLLINDFQGTGRYAFRYVVGNTNLDGDYVGIDSVRAYVPEPGTMTLLAASLLAFGARRRSQRAAASA